MKKYRLSFAAHTEHKPEHPERTGYRHGRGMDFDVYFQVWPNRPALLATIHMQQKREPSNLDWKPWIKEFKHA